MLPNFQRPIYSASEWCGLLSTANASRLGSPKDAKLRGTIATQNKTLTGGVLKLSVGLFVSLFGQTLERAYSEC